MKFTVALSPPLQLCQLLNADVVFLQRTLYAVKVDQLNAAFVSEDGQLIEVASMAFSSELHSLTPSTTTTLCRSAQARI